MSRQALPTYLNDHLAGSVAAVQLLDRLIDYANMADVRETLTELRANVVDDQKSLESVLHTIGGRTSTLRYASGWLAEKAGQVKLLFDDPERGTLARLEAFELLQLGVHGKRGLWRALLAIQPQVSELRAFDLARLEQRADSQHALLEELRVDSARRALTAEST